MSQPFVRLRRLYRIHPRSVGEISPRSGHISECIGLRVLVWGGYQDTDTFDDRYLSPADLWSYCIDFDMWQRHTTQGTSPPGTSGASSCIVNNMLYILFGHTSYGNTNMVYKLNLVNFQWKCVVPSDSDPSPRDKLVAWSYKKNIYSFGGYGVNINQFLCDYGDFVSDTTEQIQYFEPRGWNNQLCIFNTETEQWSNPKTRGVPPTPRAAHGAARLGDKVYIFGGRHTRTRMNDLHCLDLEMLTWSGKLQCSSVIPCGRSWHTFTSVSYKSIFLYGGYTQDQIPLGDAWLLDVDTLQWTTLTRPMINPRLWHTTVVSSHDDILVFGGCTDDILNHTTSQHSNTFLRFRIQPKSLLRMSLETVFNYRMETMSSWPYLPSILCNWLDTRLKCVSKTTHPNFQPVENNNERASTCQIT